MPAARLLTTTRCAGYVRALARAGHRVDAIEWTAGDLPGTWDAQRELPEPVRTIAAAHAIRGLQRGAYDAVVVHSAHELDLLPDAAAPEILVLHERRELLDLFGDGPATWDAALRARVDRASIVCAGAEVASSWSAARAELPVIPPAVDPAEWPSGDRSVREAVTVAPFAVERAALDTAYLVAMLSSGPGLTVLGTNPGLGIESNTAARPSRRRAFARACVYVNLANPAFELMTPMPLVEAMAAALPIVTLPHPASPIVHEVNGLVAGSAAELSRHTQRLLDDEATARALGAAARRTVEEQYAQRTFDERWHEVLRAHPRPVRRTA